MTICPLMLKRFFVTPKVSSCQGTIKVTWLHYVFTELHDNLQDRPITCQTIIAIHRAISNITHALVARWIAC